MNKHLGFLILSFTQPDEQFIRLLDRLLEFKNHSIAIHHDKAQGGPFPQEIVDRYRIQLVEPSHRTYWSHINNVIATIDGIELLYQTHPEMDWLITLTPACYPIKPINEIETFYDQCLADGLIDMEPIGQSAGSEQLHEYIIRDFTFQPWFYLPFISRKGKFYWRTFRRKINASPHPYLDSYRLFHGSNWLSLGKKAIRKIIDGDLKHSVLVNFYSKNIVANPNMHPCPQETVLQTFIGNQADLKIDANNYRYINWKNTNNWSPNILTMAHWTEIKETQAHWARKLDSEISSELVLTIDNQILRP